jgi:uncharacterized protein
MGAWVKKHGLGVYFALALLLTWLIEAPLIAARQGWTERPVPMVLHYFGAYGPMLAAFVVTGLGEGTVGLKELLGRITRWRVGWKWFAVALLSPALLFGIGVAVARILTGEWPSLGLLGRVNYLPDLGLGAWLLWFLTFGLGEETGWRGFALPRLQRTRSAAASTLFLGLFWIVWHLPAFFYLDTYQDLGLWMLPGFAFSVLCGAVVYTWIYNSTGGSILMAALWHASFNFFSASDAGQGIVQIAMSAGVVVAGLTIPRVLGPEHFSRTPRHRL